MDKINEAEHRFTLERYINGHLATIETSFEFIEQACKLVGPAPIEIILFSGNRPEKILSGEKTVTARFWKRKPPPIGKLFRAQRGRRKDTAFALCEVTKVEEWSGYFDDDLLTHTRAVQEGFGEYYDAKWEFHKKYMELNETHWGDFERTHYFISFKVKEILEK